jgi:AcrR family transcriptional regulator
MEQLRGSVKSHGLAHPDDSATDFRTEIHEFKKGRILEVALDLFFTKGYERTTLSAISRQLGATKPFIYAYFQNKSEILSAICEVGISRPLEALDHVRRAGLPAAEMLRRVVGDVTAITIENQAHIVVYDREEMNLEPAAAQHLMQLRREFDGQLESLLKEGIESGDFDVENPELTAGAISGMFTWIACWLRPGCDSKAEIMGQAVGLVDKMVRRDSG